MVNVFYTMEELNRAAASNDENFSDPKTYLTPEERAINNACICMLRLDRESRFHGRSERLSYGHRPLRLHPTLPLPDPQLGDGGRPWLLSMEHLQDYCNKSTLIYSNGCSYDFSNLYKYIFDRWCHGTVHKLDIEFQRFFAKLVEFEQESTTEQIVTMHKAMIEATQAAHREGFVKNNNTYYCRNNHFIGGHQVEFFRIKPLLRALIIIIAKELPEEATNFDQLEVRLVRTGFKEGLSQPITFDGLTTLRTIDENEVIATLPEAIRFIMHLDEREEALAPKRDKQVIEHYLGYPKTMIEAYRKHDFFISAKWTDGDLPVGPSTEWWKDGYISDEKHPKLLITAASEELPSKDFKIS